MSEQGLARTWLGENRALARARLWETRLGETRLGEARLGEMRLGAHGWGVWRPRNALAMAGRDGYKPASSG